MTVTPDAAPASAATAHQVDEHVSLADLATLTRIYRSFIEGYFAR